MSDTKTFHIGDVLSITDGALVSPDHIGGVYSILGWMTGESLMTHQLTRVSRECEPFLAKQHPELAAVKVQKGLDSWPKVKAFLESLYPQFGETVEVARLDPQDHTIIDPIAEIKMIRPDAEIIQIQVPKRAE